MRVKLADDPMSCVVIGAGKTLEHLPLLRRYWWARKITGRPGSSFGTVTAGGERRLQQGGISVFARTG